MNRVILLCILALTTLTAYANTEQIRFILKNTNVVNIHNASTLTLSQNTLTEEVSPTNYHQKVTNRYQIDAKPDHMYEVRVCWPASSPADFDLEYSPEEHIVAVTCSANYYSHNTHLMENPNSVPYQVVLNKVIFNALPSDIMSTVGLVATGVTAAYILSSYCLL